MCSSDLGLLVIVMPNSVNLRKRLSVLTGHTNHVPVDQLYHSQGTWRGHVREYTLKETTYICRSTGLAVVTAEHYEAIAYTRLTWLWRQMYMLPGRLVPGLRSGILVTARKPAGWRPADPDPDAEVSFRERQRLLDSWNP